MNKITIALISTILSSSVSAHETGSKHTHKDGGYITEASGEFISTTDITAHKWDARGKSDEEITARIKYLAEKSDPRTPAEREGDKKYIKKYADAIVIDTIFIGGIGYAGVTEEQFWGALDRQLKGDFTAESTSVSNGDASLGGSPIDVAKATDKVIDASDSLIKVRSIADIRKAKAMQKTGIFYNVQGSDFVTIDNIDADVKAAAQAGILQANITYNIENAYGTGLNVNDANPEGKGLTKAGIKLVEAYNKYGIVVDCTHSSDAVCIDIAKYSKKPVMISHSNARALMDITRNVSDEAILEVAKTDGVISVNFLGGFLNKEGDASSEAIAKHIIYIADLITKKLGKDGKRHVGFAADYVHSYADALEVIIRTPERYTIENGYGSVTEQAYPADVWGVVPVLEDKYGWTKEEVEGFLGANALRVYAANWKVKQSE